MGVAEASLPEVEAEVQISLKDGFATNRVGAATARLTSWWRGEELALGLEMILGRVVGGLTGDGGRGQPSQAAHPYQFQ